jgi:hypothetical protein
MHDVKIALGASTAGYVAGTVLKDPATGQVYGYANGSGGAVQIAMLAENGADLVAGASVVALSEAQPVRSFTGTTDTFTGACEYAGFRVRAISGTPQTVTVYDATSATGTPIHTESVTATGYFPWAGNKRRINATGCHVVVSGGTSRTIDVLVG